MTTEISPDVREAVRRAYEKRAIMKLAREAYFAAWDVSEQAMQRLVGLCGGEVTARALVREMEQSNDH